MNNVLQFFDVDRTDTPELSVAKNMIDKQVTVQSSFELISFMQKQYIDRGWGQGEEKLMRFQGPLSQRVYPANQRIYFDMTPFGANETICLRYNLGHNALWCGQIPNEEPIFVYDAGEGYHAVTAWRNNATIVGAVFFRVAHPKIFITQLELTPNYHLTIHGAVQHFEPFYFTKVCAVLDSDTRICLKVPETDSWNIQHTDVQVPFGALSLGIHTLSLVLVNNVSKALALSDPIEMRISSNDTQPREASPVENFEPRDCSPVVAKAAPWVCHLKDREWGFYSQNGEDGILLSIFANIGTTNKYYVEFGVEDGLECNTRLLRDVYGWTGLMMDGGYHNPDRNLQR